MLRLLQDNAGSSFSDLWYRIGPTRPRLGAHAQVIRQRFGGRTIFILEDPAGGQYFRVSESAHFFLGLLNGTRTADDAWQACIDQLGDGAPTQRECIDILARLQLFGLIVGELPIDPEMLEVRRTQLRSQRIKQRTGMGLAPTLPLLNPEPWLERWSSVLRAIFSPLGLAVWIAVIAWGLFEIGSKLGDLFNGYNQIIDPSNLLIGSHVFLCLRAWHEFGHAAACKALGGRCTEVGLIFMLFVLPFPYCDTSSAWRFPEVWKRVVVSAGGIIFETFVAALAAILWSRTDEPLLRSVCFNIMVISGFTTLVFNLNPLLRYDGYYILSDLTGAANLWQRSRDLWRFLFEKFAFKSPGVTPPFVRHRAELWFLLIYGLASYPYRAIISFSIILVLWSNPAYSTLAPVLAIIAAIAFLLWPVLKGISYLATSPKLLGRRGRAVGVSAAAVSTLVLFLGVLPLPDEAYAPGVIRAEDQVTLRAPEDGFVDRIHVHVGQSLRAGDLVLTLRNPDLILQAAVADAKWQQAHAELDSASTKTLADREVAERSLDAAKAELERARARVDALVITSPIDGTFAAGSGTDIDLQNLNGKFATKGSIIGLVATSDRLIVRATVSDRDQAYVFSNLASPNTIKTSVRIAGSAATELPAELIRVAGAGSRKISEEALGSAAGGEVLLDPTDPKRLSTLTPQFVVEVRPSFDRPPPAGVRARVRLGLESRPLLSQWWRRAAQLLTERSQL